MVSIIVPIYNMEKYLPRCIESILNQTYEEIELILVDDGSTDKSRKICDFYAKKDDRIKVIHKKNGGVSDARNTGIDYATGQYISFIDGDDWIEKNYLKKLLLLMENNNTQLSVGSFDFRDLKTTFLPKQPYESIDLEKPVFKDCIMFFNGWLRYGTCAKMFRRDIIISNNIKFNIAIKHGEDTLFVNEYLSKCNKIYITNDIIYHYNRLVEDSATKKFYSDFADWNLTLVNSLVKVLDLVKISTDQRKQILDLVVIDRICNIVSGFVNNLPYEDAMGRIYNTISEFDKWILTELPDSNATDGKQKLRHAIRTKDIEMIYQEQKKLLNKKRIKRIVKGILYRVLTPIIERTRDGLIDFKE